MRSTKRIAMWGTDGIVCVESDATKIKAGRSYKNSLCETAIKKRTKIHVLGSLHSNIDWLLITIPLSLIQRIIKLDDR